MDGWRRLQVSSSLPFTSPSAVLVCSSFIYIDGYRRNTSPIHMHFRFRNHSYFSSRRYFVVVRTSQQFYPSPDRNPQKLRDGRLPTSPYALSILLYPLLIREIFWTHPVRTVRVHSRMLGKWLHWQTARIKTCSMQSRRKRGGDRASNPSILLFVNKPVKTDPTGTWHLVSQSPAGGEK